MIAEVRALEKNETWEVMNLPRGKKPMGCKWVFTVKYRANGLMERYKAHLITKGFTQTYGILHGDICTCDKTEYHPSTHIFCN